MTQKVKDIYSDTGAFEQMLEDATDAAFTSWEIDFCCDMNDRFNRHREDTYLSESQLEQLKRIAERDQRG